MHPPKHAQENERLKALYRYEILDTPPEQAFDDVTRLVASICRVPIAVINLIDAERQWFKSEIGLGVRETPLDISICAHAILQPGFFTVADTLEDARFSDNPLVTGDPHLRFYAGVLLKSEEGHPLGTLCALDYVPRELSEEQQEAMLALGRQVMEILELKIRNRQLTRAVSESNHRIKNSFQTLDALIEVQQAHQFSFQIQRIRHFVRSIALSHDLIARDAEAEHSQKTVSIRAFIEPLVNNWKTMTQSRSLTLELSDFEMSLKRVMAVAALTNELLANAVKHSQEEIQLSLSLDENQKAVLRVRDQGRGFPANFDPAAASNIGMELVLSLAQWDLQGSVVFQNWEGGGEVRVVFPV